MEAAFDIDNMYCGVIERGDIFLYESKKGEKAVVVLQDNVLNEGLSTIVCAILEPREKGDHVFANEVLLVAAENGLGVDALCKLYKIETLDRRGIIAKKGELSSERLFDIYRALDINCGRFRDNIMDLD
ncbi:type II toxin-antitoxin system PemK/MazF family toxin [Candidatus Nomurabacteria bacterium]|nr:type II toxin-antitoxin system PemK/MazF family toxin [Candidatus Nomurabacteria bacterium]